MFPNKYFSIESTAPKEKRIIIFTLLSAAALGLISIYFSPTEKLFSFFNVPTVNGCPLLTLTNIPCPFCGMGRSFSCLTDLKIARSFYYNPMGLIFYVLSASIFGAVFILSIFNKKVVFKRSAKELWYIPVLFVIIMWVINILYGHHH